MDDNLSSLVQKFEAAEEASQDSRAEAEKARDYYDGRQLTPEQIAALKKRKQPIVIENLIQPKVDYLCGLERQSRTDPKAYPRTAMHEDDANAATDALRYVADDQSLDIKRSSVFNNMLVEGFGGVEVGVKKVKEGIDPSVKLVDWDRLFTDPHSARPDYSDANYLGYVTWMDLADAKDQWPDKVAALDAAMGSTSTIGETLDDKPRVKWSDPARRRVRIVTMFCKIRGAWHKSVFTKSGELEPLAPSEFVDDEGNPECPLILQSAYVDRDNDRYGPVRHWMTLQDEVNKRRSKFLHLTNSRTLRVSPNVTQSADEVRKEMTNPNGVFIGEQGDVEDLTSHNMAAGHFNLLAEAKDAIKQTGPNATMQGKAGQDQSGRAILALQQGGMTEMAPLLDNLRHFNIRVYRAIWNRIRQYWTAERWVRVTDDEKNVRFVGFNAPRAADAMMKVQTALKSGQIDVPTAQAFAQQVQMDPSMQQPINVVAEIDVDIQIDEVMDAPTLQIEQFEQLAKLAPMAPPQYLPTMFELMVEASNLRNKDKLREIMEQAKQAMSQPDPAQEQMKQIAIAGEAAKVAETESKTAKNVADAQATVAGSQISAFQAGASAAA